MPSRSGTATRPCKSACRSRAWSPFSSPKWAVNPDRAAGPATRIRTMPFVYGFDHKHRKPPMQMKELLGGKGATLAEMTSVLGLPVPAGLTISTDACRTYMASGWPDGLDAEVARHLATLQKTMGRRLGDPS